MWPPCICTKPTARHERPASFTGTGAGTTHRAAGWVEGGRTGRRGGDPAGRRWPHGRRGCNRRPPVYYTAPAASAFQPRCWCSPPGRAETPKERDRRWAALWSGLALWIQASHNYMVRPCLEWMNEWLRNGRERTRWNSRKHFKALKYVVQKFLFRHFLHHGKSPNMVMIKPMNMMHTLKTPSVFPHQNTDLMWDRN